MSRYNERTPTARDVAKNKIDGLMDDLKAWAYELIDSDGGEDLANCTAREILEMAEDAMRKENSK